jgi:hypothetical protein
VGNNGQIAAGLRDPEAAFNADAVRDLANEKSKGAYPDLPSSDNIRDAFRHFYWVAGMTRLMGPTRALSMANAHEANYPLMNAHDARAREMDTYNNYVAAKMATNPKFSGMNTEELTEFAIANKCLQTGLK